MAGSDGQPKTAILGEPVAVGGDHLGRRPIRRHSMSIDGNPAVKFVQLSPPVLGHITAGRARRISDHASSNASGVDPIELM
ncbi:MAG: hypothetical protein R2697_01990 [Ilumatobacteraceae bacterium]